MSEIIEIVFLRTWWQYGSRSGDWFNTSYHWFNMLEGVIWLGFAGLVVRRYLRHRHSHSKIWYALAFSTFAGSDFCEAWQQSSWLIWLKLLNLIVLIRIRRRVMSTYYPEATVDSVTRYRIPTG